MRLCKVNSVLTVDELLQVITDIARDLVGAHVAVSVSEERRRTHGRAAARLRIRKNI